VHVMNCVDSTTVKADAFDAKDTVYAVAASSKDVSTGDNQQLHCAGEGKGYCQVFIKFKGSPETCGSTATDSGAFNVDSGKWAVVQGVTVTGSCYPAVVVVDSQPTSCEKFCGRCEGAEG